MEPRKWLLLTTALIIGIAALSIAVNMLIDPYGLFRPVSGRRLSAYGDTRISKYLLNMRYVPENFNAVLIGNSLSANWNMRGIEKVRVYNDSINGGNIVEEKAIVESALARHSLSVAFITVNPDFTTTHNFKTAVLDPALKWSALGSISLGRVYKGMFLDRLHPGVAPVDDVGTVTFPAYPTDLDEGEKDLWLSGGEFPIDSVAWQSYKDLIAELRRHGVRIFFVIPPTSEWILTPRRQAFDNYVRLVATDIAGPEDTWIDFASKPYEAFRADRSNFNDGVHLYPSATERIVAEMNRVVDQRLHQTR